MLEARSDDRRFGLARRGDDSSVIARIRDRERGSNRRKRSVSTDCLGDGLAAEKCGKDGTLEQVNPGE